MDQSFSGSITSLHPIKTSSLLRLSGHKNLQQALKLPKEEPEGDQEIPDRLNISIRCKNELLIGD